MISSATLDAGRFSEFYRDAPVVEVEGRTYPVEDYFLPGQAEEELRHHVARAVDWISEVDDRGDVLVFLPGEREIRECAKLLQGRILPDTEILPVYARLTLAQQQQVFRASEKTVSYTHLTLPTKA